jgi:glutaconyl-CoA/methylmalonyl-CoA decarboxylase subunit gamma
MKLRITVEGKTYEVDVEVLDGELPVAGGYAPAPAAAAPAAPIAAPAPLHAAPAAQPPAPAPPASSGTGKVCRSPLAGTVTKLLVAAGDTVVQNQPIVVMEAMKMETNVASTVAGTVTAVRVAAGSAVKDGDVLMELA